MCVPFVTGVIGAVERREVEVLRAAVVRGEVDAAPVRRPREVVRRAVERRRQCRVPEPSMFMTYSS